MREHNGQQGMNIWGFLRPNCLLPLSRYGSLAADVNEKTVHVTISAGCNVLFEWEQ